MRKGSLALDFIGKWVLILVAVVVAIGLIVTFSSKIRQGIIDIFTKDEPETSHVRVELETKAQEISKIAELIELCHSTRLNTNDDETCYILQNTKRSFDATAQEINNSLSSGMRKNVIFSNQKYSRETIVLSYVWIDKKVVVAQ